MLIFNTAKKKKKKCSSTSKYMEKNFVVKFQTYNQNTPTTTYTKI